MRGSFLWNNHSTGSFCVSLWIFGRNSLQSFQVGQVVPSGNWFKASQSGSGDASNPGSGGVEKGGERRTVDWAFHIFQVLQLWKGWKLGGGFKYIFLFPLFGEMIKFDEHIAAYFSDGLLQPPTRKQTKLPLFLTARYLEVSNTAISHLKVFSSTAMYFSRLLTHPSCADLGDVCDVWHTVLKWLI